MHVFNRLAEYAGFDPLENQYSKSNVVFSSAFPKLATWIFPSLMFGFCTCSNGRGSFGSHNLLSQMCISDEDSVRLIEFPNYREKYVNKCKMLRFAFCLDRINSL